MSVAKGTKFKDGYSTVAGAGLDFRRIAQAMTAAGHPMNYSTARNIFLRTLEKVVKSMDPTMSALQVEKVSRMPTFQQALLEILSEP